MKEESNMNINRFNYEEYFLLYTDNELNAAEKAEVEHFVSENPDLAEELALLTQSVIKPEKHLVFTNKEMLMKSSLEENGINESNYETYFILYVDDELSNPEKAAVEAFIYAHPELESTFDIYQQTKSQPEKISFPGKEKLYRHEEDQRVVPIHWWKIAAAAAVILLAGFFWLNQPAKQPDQPQVADNTERMGKSTDTVANETKALSNNTSSSKEIAGATPGATLPGKVLVHPKEVSNLKPETTVHLAQMTKAQKGDNLKDPAESFTHLTTTEAGMHKEPDVAIARPDGMKRPEIIQQAVHQEIPEDNNATLAFASDQQSENVFLANISVNRDVPLRGFFRKASRVINKVTALKNGTRPGVSIGNIEIAIQ